jgi:hypothetical protein
MVMVCEWFDLKTIRTVFTGLTSKLVVTVSGSLASKPMTTVGQWFGLKITGTVSHRFGPQNRWRRFMSGLASKPLGWFSPVWPQNHLDNFCRFSLKTGGDGFYRFGLKTCCDGFLQFALKICVDGFSRFDLKTGGRFLG